MIRVISTNVGGCRPDSGNPFLHGLGDELRVIVGTNVLRDATQETRSRERVDDIDGFQLLALNVSAGTARFLQLSEAFRKTYVHGGPFSGWPTAGSWYASDFSLSAAPYGKCSPLL